MTSRRHHSRDEYESVCTATTTPRADLVQQDIPERQPGRDVVDIKEAVERAVHVDPVANASAHRFAVPVMLRVTDEDPDLLQVTPERPFPTTDTLQHVDAVSQHAAELVGEVRRETLNPVSIAHVPLVPAQRLLLDSQFKPPTVHRNREELGGDPPPVRGPRGVTHVGDPGVVLNQRRFRQYDDSRELRIVPS